MTVAEETEVVHEELDGGAGDGYGALKGIHGLDALRREIECDGRHQAVGADDRLFADIQEEEGACAVLEIE